MGVIERSVSEIGRYLGVLVLENVASPRALE